MRYGLLLFLFLAGLAPDARAEASAPGLRGEVAISAQSQRRARPRYYRHGYRGGYRGWYGGYFPGPVAGYDGNTYYGTSTAWRYDGYPSYAGGGLPNYGSREYNSLRPSGASYYPPARGRCRAVYLKGGRSVLQCRWRD